MSLIFFDNCSKLMVTFCCISRSNELKIDFLNENSVDLQCFQKQINMGSAILCNPGMPRSITLHSSCYTAFWSMIHTWVSQDFRMQCNKEWVMPGLPRISEWSVTEWVTPRLPRISECTIMEWGTPGLLRISQ